MWRWCLTAAFLPSKQGVSVQIGDAILSAYALSVNRADGPSGRECLLRWVLCWYGKAAVNRLVVGSIPTYAA